MESPKTNYESLESQLTEAYTRVHILEEARSKAQEALRIETERWGGLYPGQARVLKDLVCVIDASGKRTLYKKS